MRKRRAAGRPHEQPKAAGELDRGRASGLYTAVLVGRLSDRVARRNSAPLPVTPAAMIGSEGEHDAGGVPSEAVTRAPLREPMVLVSTGGGADDADGPSGRAEKRTAEEERWACEKDWKNQQVFAIQARIEQAIADFERRGSDRDEPEDVYDPSAGADFRDRTEEILTSFKLLSQKRQDILHGLNGWLKRYGARGGLLGTASSRRTPKRADGGGEKRAGAGSDGSGDDGGHASDCSSDGEPADPGVSAADSPAAREVLDFSSQVTHNGHRLAALHTQMLADARDALFALEQKLQAATKARDGLVGPLEVRQLNGMLSQSQEVVEQLRSDLEIASVIQLNTANRLAHAEKAARSKEAAAKLLRRDLERVRAAASDRESELLASGGAQGAQLLALRAEVARLQAANEQGAQALQACEYDLRRLEASELAVAAERRELEAERQQMAQDRAALKMQSVAQSSLLARLRDSVARREPGLRACVAAVAADVRALESENRDLRHAKDELDARLIAFAAEAEAAEAERRTAAGLRSEVGKLLDELSRVKEDANEHGATHRATATRLAELEAEAAQARGRLARAESKASQFLAANVHAQRALNGAAARERALHASLADADAQRALELAANDGLSAQLRMARARRAQEQLSLKGRISELERMALVVAADHARELAAAREEARAEALELVNAAAERHARNAAARIGALEGTADDKARALMAERERSTALEVLEVQVATLEARERGLRARAQIAAAADVRLRAALGGALRAAAEALGGRADALRAVHARAGTGEAGSRIADELSGQLAAMEAAAALLAPVVGAETEAAPARHIPAAAPADASAPAAAADPAGTGTAAASAAAAAADGVRALQAAAAHVASIAERVRASAATQSEAAAVLDADLGRFAKRLALAIEAHTDAVRTSAHRFTAGKGRAGDVDGASAAAPEAEEGAAGGEVSAEGRTAPLAPEFASWRAWAAHEAEGGASERSLNKMLPAARSALVAGAVLSGAERTERPLALAEAADRPEAEQQARAIAAFLARFAEWATGRLEAGAAAASSALLDEERKRAADARARAQAAAEASATAALAGEAYSLRVRAEEAEAARAATGAAVGAGAYEGPWADARAQAALGRAAMLDSKRARADALERALASSRPRVPQADSSVQTDDAAALLARAAQEAALDAVWRGEDAAEDELAAFAAGGEGSSGARAGTLLHGGAEAGSAARERAHPATRAEEGAADESGAIRLVRRSRRVTQMGVAIVDVAELWAAEDALVAARDEEGEQAFGGGEEAGETGGDEQAVWADAAAKAPEVSCASQHVGCVSVRAGEAALLMAAALSGRTSPSGALRPARLACSRRGGVGTPASSAAGGCCSACCNPSSPPVRSSRNACSRALRLPSPWLRIPRPLSRTARWQPPSSRAASRTCPHGCPRPPRLRETRPRLRQAWQPTRPFPSLRQQLGPCTPRRLMRHRPQLRLPWPVQQRLLLPHRPPSFRRQPRLMPRRLRQLMQPCSRPRRPL